MILLCLFIFIIRHYRGEQSIKSYFVHALHFTGKLSTVHCAIIALLQMAKMFRGVTCLCGNILLTQFAVYATLILCQSLNSQIYPRCRIPHKPFFSAVSLSFEPWAVAVGVSCSGLLFFKFLFTISTDSLSFISLTLLTSCCWYVRLLLYSLWRRSSHVELALFPPLDWFGTALLSLPLVFYVVKYGSVDFIFILSHISIKVKFILNIYLCHFISQL